MDGARKIRTHWKLDRVERAAKAAEELRRMNLRTLAFKLMVISPILLLGSIAAESRFYIDPFQTVSCTSQQQEAITAYVQPVRESAPLALDSYKTPSPAKVRSIAHIWVAGAESGALKPLTPAYYEDSIRSAIKNQVKSANDAVAERLVSLSQNEAEAGQTWNAVQDGVLALKVGGVLKFSDPYAVALVGTRERAIFEMIESLAPRLAKAEATKLRGQLVQIRAEQRPLEEIVRMVRANYDRERQRADINDVASRDPQLAPEVSLVRDNLPISDVLTEAKTSRLVGHNVSAHPYLPQIKLAYASQRKCLANLQHLLDSLPDDHSVVAL
jgi:hypothetical protein